MSSYASSIIPSNVPAPEGTRHDSRSPEIHDRHSRGTSEENPLVAAEDVSPAEVARCETSQPVCSEWSPADPYVQYAMGDTGLQETSKELTTDRMDEDRPEFIMPPEKELLPLPESPPDVNPPKPDPLSNIQFSPLGDSPASFVLPGADRISEDESPLPSMPLTASHFVDNHTCSSPTGVSSPDSPPDFILPGADPISSLSSGPPSVELSPVERGRRMEREVSFSPLGHEDMMDDDEDEASGDKGPCLPNRTEEKDIVFSPLGEDTSPSSDHVNSDLDDPLDVLSIGCGDDHLEEDFSSSL